MASSGDRDISEASVPAEIMTRDAVDASLDLSGEGMVDDGNSFAKAQNPADGPSAPGDTSGVDPPMEGTMKGFECSESTRERLMASAHASTTRAMDRPPEEGKT